MFMHALVHVFFLAFIAITLLGHVLLAEALHSLARWCERLERGAG